MSSIMDSLAGGAPPMPDSGSQSGGDQSVPDPSNTEEALRFIVDYLREVATNEADDGDTSIIDKAMTQLSSLFAGRQKQNEAAQGITPAHKAMGRAMASSQGSGGGGY